MANNKAKQFASSINYIAQLPQGDALVQAIGKGDESNNLDALSHWVERQSDLMVIDRPDYVVEQLMVRLHNKLDDFTSVFYD
jgi:hypothetical protein